MTKQRLLTKSRFKLALECPNKLFYTRKDTYANQTMDDPFLEALAKGGFQVEELARLEYPDGVLIEGNDHDYDLLVAQTNELLQKENVVIFEAAFKFNNLFIRCDILEKKGNSIKLIEVKSKSFDPNDEYTFVGKQGGLLSVWKPYLLDVAFQRYVMQHCYPQWNIRSYLKLADKTKEAQIDGLNQLFRITKTANNRTGIIKLVNSLDEIGTTVLGDVNIDTILDDIASGKHVTFDNLSFEEAINAFAATYEKDRKFNYPVSFGACKKCEFKTTPEDAQQGLQSGFKECFSEQMGWTEADFEKPTIFEVWNFRKGNKLFEADKIFLTDLTEEDLDIKPEASQLSASERQWVQIEKTTSEDTTPLILIDELRAEINSWKFPLHCIDFETSTVALPFNKGRRPYEQTAFQFSHHLLHKNGSITHESEYLHFEKGVFPNFDFIRNLKAPLSGTEGTIFRYAPHENTYLNAIYDQLQISDEPDKAELMAFIRHITKSTNKKAESWEGERNMVDLWDIVKKYYYHPLMGGSNSIKAVLPAILNSSQFLQKKYSRPISQLSMTSLNFPPEHIWLEYQDNNYLSPYKTLLPLFADWTEEQLDEVVSDLENIADGGMALTAYGKLQYTNMPEAEREEIKKALLKYCELDTLAMVMILEYFREVVS